MSRSDWLLLALNLVAIVMGMIGLAAQHVDPLSFGVVLATVAMVVNSVRLLRQRSDEPAPTRVRASAKADEMDAATVLDLDARLEALERSQVDAADAAKWRALVESGTISGPNADPAPDDSARPSRLSENGRA